MALFSIASTFIKRPVLSIVCTVLILLLGGFCIPLLPVEYLPDLAPVQVSLRADYPGADPLTIERTVTNKIEKQLVSIPGIDDLQSTTSRGSSSISVKFPNGTNKDLAQVKVQNQISQVLSQLPQPVQRNGVSASASSPNTLRVYGVSSPDGRYDDLFVANYVQQYMLDPLKQIDGVGDVQNYGKPSAVRIWLDLDQLALHDLTVLDVKNAI
ncbi:MAG: efflux RND transporter permease subunit, partial [Cyanobacteria bacterium P01_H01_bin.121]